MNPLTTEQISALSSAEKLAMIEALWDSFSDADAPISDPQKQELERRYQSFEADKAQSISWEDLATELAERGA